MAKVTKPEEQSNSKVQTKYDKKMEARRVQKQKELKQEKISKVIGICVGTVAVVAIAAAIIVPIIIKNNAITKTYVKVGEHNMTQLEYDYYYQTTVNNYLSTYSSVLPYMGLDTTKDFAEQNYSEEMTWKDMFDEMTMNQVKQIKALADDAKNTSFEYDDTQEYDNLKKNNADMATSSNISIKNYYTQTYGTYATEKNVAPFIKETLLAGAYYDKLMEDNKPTDEVVKAYYETNKQDYDKVDYRSFQFTDDTITSESSEEDIEKAMKTLKDKADAMEAAYKGGEAFEDLCIKNASDDAKANYEDEATEYCLTEAATFAGTAQTLGQWLYEDGRKEKDFAVLQDDSDHSVYVVEFIKRYYDEADNATISNKIAGEMVSGYVSAMMEKYEVVDVKGDLHYLVVAKEQEETSQSQENQSQETQEPENQTEETQEPEGQTE